ncbi:MAG TPA: hypothetical protein VE398_16675 [Acidobacteriota bacterium]|nr:hypothetical protein [Acidobacteriota bacterium]
MSYILDALKKAERERGSPRAPVLTSVQSLPHRGNRLTTIIGGFILCTAALIWLILPTLSRIVRPPTASPILVEQNRAAYLTEAERMGESAAANTPSHALPAAEPGSNWTAGVPRNAPVPPSPGNKSGFRPAAASLPQTEIVRPDAAPQQPPEAVRRPGQTGQNATSPQQSALAPASPPPAGKTSPQPSQSTYPADAGEPTTSPGAIQTKPLPLREAMAKMTLTLIMCGESGEECFVYINGRKYVKGDYVDGRYLIESITLQGPMLSYEGEKALLQR